MKKKTKKVSTANPKSPKSGASQLGGYIIWFSVPGDSEGFAERFEVQKAILRDAGGELAIDCDCARPGESPYVYTILLRRQTPLLYRGDWRTPDGRNGNCSCRMYSNGSSLALVGTWMEDRTYHWIAELSPT